jgi:hypothetical protein
VPLEAIVGGEERGCDSVGRASENREWLSGGFREGACLAILNWVLRGKAHRQECLCHLRRGGDQFSLWLFAA